MIRNKTHKIFVTEKDYIYNVSGTIALNDGEVVNTYGYSDGTVKINVDASAEGWILYNFPNLKIGDIIESECEIRSISGNKPNFDIYKGTFNTAGKQVNKQAKTTEWETVRNKYLVEEDNIFYIAFGFRTTEVGKAEIRNFAIEVTTNSKPEWNPLTVGSGWAVLDTIYDYKFEYKIVDNRVFVRGNISQTVSIENTIICVLPTKIWPIKIVPAIAGAQIDANTDNLLWLRVNHMNGRFEVMDGAIELNKVVGFYFSYDLD